jgi:uncharacterized protein YndB with AHSA1/START domain
MHKPATIYITYIIAPAEKIWSSLTGSEFTRQYFSGLRVESDWKVGSAVKYFQPDGTLHISGRVLVAEEPKLLSITWHVESMEEFRKLPETIVTFEIEALGAVSRLTITESMEEPIDEILAQGGRKGWPMILSSLKSLLETGHALPKFDMSSMQKTVQEMMAHIRAKRL